MGLWLGIFVVLIGIGAQAKPQFEAIPEDESLPEEVSVPKKAAEDDEEKQPGEAVDAVVRIIRASPQTEVFFMDRKESLIIPQGPSHNAIFAACLESSKKRTPVSLRIDPKARIILSVPTAKSSSQNSGSSSSSSGETRPGAN